MSLRKAIDAKCKECIYDPIAGGGTWRQQVQACTSYRCPLYPVRPLSEGAAQADRRSQVENGAVLPAPQTGIVCTEGAP